TIGGQANTYSWTITSGRLPAGLTLNAATGVISGTPLEDGYFSPRFAITNGNETLQRYITLFINAANTTVRINSNDTLPDATQNQSYSTTLFAGGASSIVWSVLSDTTYTSAVPAGMSLSSNGVLSGTPTTAGAYSFFVKAVDSGNANNYGIRR